VGLPGEQVDDGALTSRFLMQNVEEMICKGGRAGFCCRTAQLRLTSALNRFEESRPEDRLFLLALLLA
jgi:hypothetical protein